MSEKQNDGGPDFPINSPSGSPEYMPSRDGMSLRDWFAGQVVGSVLMAASNGHFSECRGSEGTAKLAYAIADALLAERGKT